MKLEYPTQNFYNYRVSVKKKTVHVVAIDEMQFFQYSLAAIVKILVDRGIQVVSSGTRYGFQKRTIWLNACRISLPWQMM